MKLDNKKKVAGKLLKLSPKRVVLDSNNLSKVKDAVTKEDIRALIDEKVITSKQKNGISRVRARRVQEQRKKGRRTGAGKKRGKITTRIPKKRTWINKVRLQRTFLKELKDKEVISPENYRNLYRKSKGGFFRSKRHIKVYITDHGLAKSEMK